MNKHEETAYTVSRSAIEKIARTAALGTEGVAKEKGSSFSVRQKDGRITVDPDVMQIDVTIEDIVMPARA